MNDIKTIAITGSSGYIGGYLKNHLQKLGMKITNMNRNARDKNEAYIAFDLNKKNNMDELKNTDCLIHCAYDFSAQGYPAIEKSNVTGSLDLFEQAKKMGVKKIIYLSSVSAFEGAISDYGRAKYKVELLAKKFNVITVRPGLVFNKHPNSIVGTINKLIQKFPVIPLIGKGDQRFFPCHMDDLSNLIQHLVQQNDLISSPIFAASENSISFKDFILILSEFNKKRVKLIPLPYFFIYSTLKIAELLPIKIGLRSDSLKYLKNYNKNPDFSELKKTGVKFREFNLSTLSE